jgi:hypothetical protein
VLPYPNGSTAPTFNEKPLLCNRRKANSKAAHEHDGFTLNAKRSSNGLV